MHANEVEIETCSDEDVCKRGYQLYSGSPIVSRWMKGELTTEVEVNVVEVITKWRYRLVDISWLIHSHPWRSPFGPAKAVLICSL